MDMASKELSAEIDELKSMIKDRDEAFHVVISSLIALLGVAGELSDFVDRTQNKNSSTRCDNITMILMLTWND